MNQQSKEIQRSKHPGTGRPKGARSRKAAAREQAAKASGQTPLDYMVAVINDPQADPRRRHDLARAVAPYCHPLPASVGRSHVTATVPGRCSDSATILGRYLALWDSWPNGVTFPGMPSGDVLAEQYVYLVRKMVAEETRHGGPKA